MSHLQRLADRYAPQGLAVLGFNSADKVEIALQFLRRNKATFPNIIDSSTAARRVGSRDYRCSGVPLSYIIDREGRVVEGWYGYRKGHPRALRILRRLGVVGKGKEGTDRE